jgi:alpha-1,3/alpha-1,6-mannosyltransferase
VPTALAIPASVEVLFLLSIPGAFKSTLLRNAKLLIYTPTNEHFGIVPVEAMQYGVPVLAANTGGPLETVLDGKTGWLRDVDDVGAWTQVMRRVMDGGNAAEMIRISQNGKQRVNDEFSRSKMSLRFKREIEEMTSASRKALVGVGWKDVMLGLGVMGVLVVAFVMTVMNRPAESNIY